MKNQDTLRNMLISAAIFLAVLWFLPSIIPIPQGPPKGEEPRQSTTAPAMQQDPTPTKQAAAPATTSPGATAGDLEVVEAAEEGRWSLGTPAAEGSEKDASPFRMHLQISNVGASVATATMTDHAESLKGKQRYRLLSEVERLGLPAQRSLSVERININGEIDLELSERKWNCSQVTTFQSADGTTGQELSCSLDVMQAGKPFVTLRRVFQLPQQPVKSGRHDLFTDLIVTNHTEQALRVRLTYAGGVGVRRVTGREWRGVDVGIRLSDGRIEGTRHTIDAVTGLGGMELELFSPSNAAPQTQLEWASISNIYFTCTVAPRSRDLKQPAGYLQAIAAFDGDGNAATSEDVSMRFVVGGESIAPASSLNYPAEVYVGPKEFDAFRTAEPYKSRNYYFQISQGYGCCTFPWLVEFMIWLLNGLFSVVKDFGVAIIILVLVVRTLLHPITKKGQVNMVRMQKQMQELAPKIEEIKKKYANDKARMNQEMMKLNINPAGQMLTCLPMFLQMPIWVALYISLSNNILMRHKPFLFTWVQDLTAQDKLIPFDSPFIIPIFGWQITAFNLLPVLLAISMYVQQKLQPKPKPTPNMTDQQKQQQEMMQKMAPMMSIMMFVIFYTMPAGLNLYIMASSIFGAIEQHRIRKHIKEREDAGTLLKPKAKKSGDAKASKPGWLAKLEHMADEAKKQQAKRTDPKKRKK